MVTLEYARSLFAPYFVGPNELNLIKDSIRLNHVPAETEIPFSQEQLKATRDRKVLIYCPGEPITLNRLRDSFGIDPGVKEPCFYAQDWYLNEDFAAKKLLPSGWSLIDREIANNSRGQDPEHWLTARNDDTVLPSAVLTAWTFFTVKLLTGEHLWEHDFIWCSDHDHNGDRIYTGRYHDPDGVSKNGFNVHRHLKIRPCYGMVTVG